MSQNINLQPSAPELADLLNLLKKQIKLETNCHHIGTIQSFSALTQTAQATINYAKTFLQVDDVGNTSVTTQNYPVIVDCPCIVMGGGSGFISFPISSGDECLVLFNDRDMDNWFSGSSSSAPATGRLHAFSDAIVLVGLRSLPNVIIGYDDSAVTISYDGNTFKLKSDRVIADLSPVPGAGTITFEYTDAGKLGIKNVTGEFVSALNTLFMDIQSATAGGFPLIMPTFTTDLLIFQSFKE